MNCANHPEKNAVAFCRECGKPMCDECQRPALGSVYCGEHLPVFETPPPIPDPARAPDVPPSGFAGSPYSASSFASSPYRAPSSAPYTEGPGDSPGSSPYDASPTPPGVPDPSVHPALALILGFFPGVGAIYNGQYAKGLTHAVVFGLLISILTNTRNGGFEALFGIMIAAWVIYQAFEAYHTARKRRYGISVEEFSSLFDTRPAHGRFPIGAVVLIGLGFILLLDTTEIISMEQFERYWPVLLIGFGLYLLYSRLNPADDSNGKRGGRQGARP